VDQRQHGGQLLALPLPPTSLGAPWVPAAPAPPHLPVQPVVAFPMDAGVAVALIHFGQALGVVEALGAEAGEAVDAVLAGAPVVAGVAGALVDVDVAHAPWERVGVSKCHPTGCMAWHGGRAAARGAPTGQDPLQPPGARLPEAPVSGHTCTGRRVAGCPPGRVTSHPCIARLA